MPSPPRQETLKDRRLGVDRSQGGQEEVHAEVHVRQQVDLVQDDRVGGGEDAGVLGRSCRRPRAPRR